MAGLTKRAVDAAKPQVRDYFAWCATTPGFGVRVYPSGRKVFISQIRVGRATRRVKIGVYGPYTVEQARARAEEIARIAHEGRDPQREKAEARSAITVAEMCELYVKAAQSGLVMTRFRLEKRLATLKIDEGRIARHIKPLMGTLRARDVTPKDVQHMAAKITQGKTAGVFKGKSRGVAVVTGGPGAATRAVGLLGGIYAWAEKHGHVAGPTPVRGIETALSAPRDRVLTVSELTALGEAIKASHAKSPAAGAALRLIALTGMRREEACGLRWSEIDSQGHCVRLGDTKTGRSMRPMGALALALLQSLAKTQSSETWVFPNRDDSGSADLKKTIGKIFDAAGLNDARSHDLRRTFASVAADEGYSDATIGEMLGHARRGVTARHYIRRPDAALVAAADKVSATLAAALDGRQAEDNVVRLQSEMRAG